eukprot:3106669-Pyramimonas_sp.AAC.1
MEGLQSGKYQHFVDKVLPTCERVHEFPVPVNQNKCPMRTIRHMPVKLIYESVQDELTNDLDVFFRLHGPAENRPAVMRTPSYTRHPIVQLARAEGRPDPLPLA